jgi:hypothetical protein
VIYSTSSFARLVLLAAAVGCAGARPVATLAGQKPLLVLPVANLSGGSAPLAEVQASVLAALQARGISVIERAATDAFLSRHRLRYTGDIDRDLARAAGEELGAGGIVITVLAGYSATVPPHEAISMRLVAARQGAELLWIDQAARAGDDAPGLFDLGVVREVKVLQAQLVEHLTASLAQVLTGKRSRAAGCPGDSRFGPEERYRSAELDGRVRTVAVLPFVNQTQRRNAGELMALEVTAQLEASGRIHAVEPGVLRAQLVEYRLPMEGGVSLDAARVLLELAGADVIVAGTVRELEDAAGGNAPRVEFSMQWLDRRDEAVVWQSTSFRSGDDRVFFFGQGYVSTAAELACRMARRAVDLAVEATPARNLREP